jgi:hypothetical protein
VAQVDRGDDAAAQVQAAGDFLGRQRNAGDRLFTELDGLHNRSYTALAGDSIMFDPADYELAISYGRYGSLRQEHSSIERQDRQAEQDCHKYGWTLLEAHADEGISGTGKHRKKKATSDGWWNASKSALTRTTN